MVVTVVVFMLSTSNRHIYIDDAFFGEQAYWLAKDGVVKTVTLVDFLETDNRLMSYHKLHIWTTALIIKIFGWSVTPVRLATLLIYIIFLFVFNRYVLQVFNHQAKNIALYSMFLFIVNPLLVLLAFTARPEIWVMALGFVSYMLIDLVLNEHYKNQNNRKTIKIILSGIFAGLAFLTHLNGLIFLVAGFLLLLINRTWKFVLLFFISGFFVSCLYFIDLLNPDNFLLWKYQLMNWPDNNITNYGTNNIKGFVMSVLYKLSEEHMRFFWGYKVWGISSFFFLSLIIGFKHLWKNFKNLLIYLLILILTLNIAGSQIAERYLIYLFPYMVIISSLTINFLMNTNNKYFVKFIFVLLFFLQLVTLTISFEDIFKRNAPHVEITSEIMSHIPTDKRVLAPYSFVYNSLESYKLVSFKAFEYYRVYNGGKLTQDEAYDRAIELNIEYIILPLDFPNTITGVKSFDTQPLLPSEKYTVVKQLDKCLILRKKTN